MWDRDRNLSELIDEKTRTFFRRRVEGVCGFPWSLWGQGGPVLSAESLDEVRLQTMRPDIAEWFRLVDNGKELEPLGTADGMSSPFKVEHDLETIGVFVIGPIKRAEMTPELRKMGRLLAGLTEVILWANFKQSLVTEIHGEVMAGSYDELLQRNKQLEESEKRYRELAESLEQKVAQKTAELKKAYVRLLQTEKMASIGQLAAGIAHEINNPLAFVKSNVSGAFRMIGELTEVVEGCRKIAAEFGDGCDSRIRPLNEILNSISVNDALEDSQHLVPETLEGLARVQKIVADLKEFSHIDDSETAMLDINRALETTLNILNHELRPGIRIVRRLDNDLPAARCHPREIAQVFLNVLLNAIQAIKDEGKIVISTGKVNGAVRVAIGDTGCGIPRENLHRIFDPFFTTKPVGQGTGTGLSVCYEVIKAHGGTIEAASEVGKGTVITIVLPVNS